MSMDYIRRTYGVPAKRGGRVEFTGNVQRGALLGTITGSWEQYIRVRMDGSGKTGTYHPTWCMKYL